MLFMRASVHSPILVPPVDACLPRTGNHPSELAYYVNEWPAVPSTCGSWRSLGDRHVRIELQVLSYDPAQERGGAVVESGVVGKRLSGVNERR